MFTTAMLGTLWFWIVVVETIILFASVILGEDEGKHYFTSISLVISLLLLQYVAGIDVLSWLVNHGSSLLIYLCSHFTMGTLWSVFKWYWFVQNSLEEYRQRKTRFLMEFNPDSARTGIMPPELKTKWEKEITAKYYGNTIKLEYPPNIKDHKNKVATWIFYWPISMTCSLLGDFTSWLANKIVSFIKRVYNFISDLVFSELKKDLEKEKEN